jgi:hypothetical protein
MERFFLKKVLFIVLTGVLFFGNIIPSNRSQSFKILLNDFDEFLRIISHIKWNV